MGAENHVFLAQRRIGAWQNTNDIHAFNRRMSSLVHTGIPSILIDLGFKAITPGVDPLAEMKKWNVTKYHSPKDDASQPIDYQTSARFSRFAALLTYLTANEERRPAWNPNDFFGQRFCHLRAACPSAAVQVRALCQGKHNKEPYGG